MTLEVSEQLIEYQLSGLAAQVQLASDLLETLCNGYVELETNVKGSGEEKCQKIEDKLGKIIEFLNADLETKKEMAILWGYKIEDATVNFWEKTSVKVVELGDTVRDKVEDIIGEEALEAAGEAGI